MSRTNLTKRTVRDPEELRTKLAEHDTALDALDITGTLPANSVSNSELRQSGALAVVGRSANSTGNVADIQATAASDSVLRESGSTIGFGTVATAGIADGAVTTAKLGTELTAAGQTLSGPGAVNLTTPVTRCTSTGANDALTLADGTVNGQRKRIIHVVDGGSVKLTAGGSLHLGDSLASITLANTWDWVELVWQTNAWFVIGWAGAGVTFA